MKKTTITASGLLAVLFTGVVSAQGVDDEAAGLESVESFATPAQPALRGDARRGVLLDGVLLIPESTNDRVMAFDPVTGDLLDADFIPADATNLSTPIQAALAPDGESILVSDQINDHVFEYDLDGNPVGLFAPAGGVDTAILDNIRGIEISPDATLLVSVGGGANADAIAEFDDTGAYIGNRIANGAGGLVSPFDVMSRSADFLVAGITSDAIHSYTFTGTANPDFAPVDTFPEQVAQIPSGNILVGNFSGTEEGVLEYLPDGTFVDNYDPASLGGYRGVYELGNGNILTTNGDGVHEIDRTGTLVETKISGVSARFITLAQQGPVVPESTPVPALNAWMLTVLVLLVTGIGAWAGRRGTV